MSGPGMSKNLLANESQMMILILSCQTPVLFFFFCYSHANELIHLPGCRVPVLCELGTGQEWVIKTDHCLLSISTVLETFSV